jgi:pyruvate formate lyase activating enzyme
MSDPDDTRPEDLMRAAAIGKSSGLRYIYAGNLPGMVGDLENTNCQNCGSCLIERYGYFIENYRVTPNGCCPDCGNAIPGRWADRFEGQIADRPFMPKTRTNFVTITGSN